MHVSHFPSLSSKLVIASNPIFSPNIYCNSKNSRDAAAKKSQMSL